METPGPLETRVALNNPFNALGVFTLGSHLKCPNFGSSCCGSAETNLSGIHEDTGSIPGLAQWVKALALP